MDALFERLFPGYLLLACLVLAQPAARFRALAGSGLVALALAAAAERSAGPLAGGRFTVLNEILAAAGALVALLGVALGRLRRHAPESDPPPPQEPSGEARAPGLLWLLGLLLAAFAPHLLLLGLGILFAVVAAVRVALGSRRPLTLLPLLAGCAGWLTSLALMLVILGPEGGGLVALRTGPFSLAAERLLVFILAVGGLLVAGLPPLHGVPWRRNLAPFAAIVVVRLIAAFPDGLTTWQVPVELLLLAGLAWSLLRNDWAASAVAGGLMALWTGVPAGAWAGSVLVAWGWLVETGAVAAAKRGVTLRVRWGGAVALPVALATVPALAAGLQAQVLLTVLAAAACALALLLRWRRGRAVPSPL